jgi:Ca2+-binding EF-hand superfamily protein
LLHCIFPPLTLVWHQVNLLMAEADEDEDGKISYEEFVPLCFDLLLKNLQDDIFLLQRNRGELENYLLEIFQYADADATGFLTHADVSNLLDMANLGLSQLQIATIVSAAGKDGRGSIGYHKFVSVAAEMIAEMFHANMLSDRRRGAEVPQDVNDLAADDLKNFLLKLFRGADPESSGMLSPSDFKRVLLSTDLGFTPEQMRRILVEADEREDESIDYRAFIDSAVETLESLKSKGTLADQERLREREAEELSKEFDVHSHTREQIESLFTAAFEKADSDNSKKLTRRQFYDAVHAIQGQIDLSRREVNALPNPNPNPNPTPNPNWTGGERPHDLRRRGSRRAGGVRGIRAPRV